MNNIIDYLRQLKIKLNIKSDTQLGLQLGLPQATIQKIMSGGMIPADETCLRIAELSGDRPEYVVAIAHASRAKGNSKSVWDKIIKTIAAASFVTLLVATLFPSYVNCILC